MALQKTSVQLDLEAVRQLKTDFPGLTVSELIRLAIDYVLTTRPAFQSAKFRLVKLKEDE